MTNKLYFGDNLDVLRDRIKDETADLVYLDPPFKSNATYNVLFKDRGGAPSESQAEAFRDTWEWGDSAESAYDDVMRANSDPALVLSGLRKWLGDNAMMAYLCMMSARLLELRAKIKPHGSLYLHCDPTASHYLKLMLDAIFGVECFRNEIIWKRANAHNDPKRYGRISDTIFFYTKGDKYIWNPQHTPYREEYYETHYKKDGSGRWFRTVPLDAPRHGEGSPNLLYDWKGKLPARSRTWAVKREIMEQYERDGLIRYTRTGTPTLLQYADEMPGVPLQNIWTDIPPVNPQAKERIGYPTQKPVALLQRIIGASSNPDDVVLDPFCGCGTTIDAAQMMNREWIGIDVTHYAVTLIEKRISRLNADYQVDGRPIDLAGARDLFRRDPYQFQWWAAWKVGAQSYRETKRGADRGIDGNIFFANGPYGTGRIIISVKGGENIGPSFVRELGHVVEREGAVMGVLVTLAEPTRAMMNAALDAGYVSKSAHGRLRKVQIVTVAELLEGRLPNLPPLPQPQRVAPRTRPKGGQLELLLPFENERMPDLGKDFVDPRFLEVPAAAE